jgi:FlaG/FlaF family flagellin (archaellin)
MKKTFLLTAITVAVLGVQIPTHAATMGTLVGGSFTLMTNTQPFPATGQASFLFDKNLGSGLLVITGEIFGSGVSYSIENGSKNIESGELSFDFTLKDSNFGGSFNGNINTGVGSGTGLAILPFITDANFETSNLTAEHISTPEPASTLSLLALGTLGAASTFKRKLKPSQSTKKETTKVS